MVVSSSKRSPSPLSSRPTTNPNLRTSESNSTIRRSFTGNPFARPSIVTNPRSFNPNTPANSPADFGRKHTLGKEAASRGFEEKENEKDPDPKGVKFKSLSKGSKNFMSPTISAVSKFTPSPRKKILGERNESIRTSISFSDVKEASVEDVDSKSEKGFNQNKTEGSHDSNFAGFDKKEVVLEVPSVRKASKRVTFTEVPLIHNEPESLSEITPKSDFVILGDTYPQLPLNSPNDSESSSKTIMNSECVNVESITKNSLCSTPISPVRALSEFPLIPKASKRDTFSHTLNSHHESESSSPITMNSDCVNIDSSFQNKTYSSPLVAPLDADPSFPPYDPKTNYLSPRPQFLRYKPNPRIEGFLNKEKELDFDEVKGLEERFVLFENFSDTDVTDETQFQDSQKESSEEPVVSESIPISSPISTRSPERTFEANRASKAWFFTSLKCISLLLVLLIACVSIKVTDIPIADSPMLKDSSFYNLYDTEVVIFAKEYFDGVAGKILKWSSETIFYLSELIPHLGEVDNLGTLQFFNLTALEERSLVGGYFGDNLQPEKMEEDYEEDDSESVEDAEAETGLLEKLIESQIFADEQDDGELEQGSFEIEEVKPKIQVEINDFESSLEIVDKESNIEFEDQLVSTSQAPEIGPEIIKPCDFKPDLVKTIEFPVDTDVRSFVELESSVADGNPVDSPTYVINDKLSAYIVLGISLVVLAIVAAIIFTNMKQVKNTTTTPNDMVHLDPVLPKKINPSAISGEHIYQDKCFSQNWPTEFDVVGDSCPSEMSSFQKSSSKEGAFRGTDKAQSQERKPRNNNPKRESLASSSGYSMGLPSYGSFTTYERIPTRHASGDEEIVTPVRRSSRIKNQIISP